jgi:hypothetical protein
VNLTLGGKFEGQRYGLFTGKAWCVKGEVVSGEMVSFLTLSCKSNGKLTTSPTKRRALAETKARRAVTEYE